MERALPRGHPSKPLTRHCLTPLTQFSQPWDLRIIILDFSLRPVRQIPKTDPWGWRSGGCAPDDGRRHCLPFLSNRESDKHQV